MTRFLMAMMLISLLTACPAAGPGSSNPPATNNTATNTATNPPTSPDQLNQTPLDLGNGQIARLNLKRQDNLLSGELVITNQATAMSVAAFTRSISIGSYSITGSFNPPRGFLLSGNFPAPLGAFQLTGNFPTQTEAGSATLASAGETVSVEIPALNSLSPTPSSTPTASQTPVANPTISPIANPTASPTISSAKVWTEAELETIISCFNTSFNPKDPSTIGAYASGRSRLNAYLATKAEISAAAHQSRLNSLGEDLIRLNNQYHFSCIKS